MNKSKVLKVIADITDIVYVVSALDIIYIMVSALRWLVLDREFDFMSIHLIFYCCYTIYGIGGVLWIIENYGKYKNKRVQSRRK